LNQCSKVSTRSTIERVFELVKPNTLSRAGYLDAVAVADASAAGQVPVVAGSAPCPSLLREVARTSPSQTMIADSPYSASVAASLSRYRPGV
jgi:hypothetical protein